MTLGQEDNEPEEKRLVQEVTIRLMVSLVPIHRTNLWKINMRFVLVDRTYIWLHLVPSHSWRLLARE